MRIAFEIESNMIDSISNAAKTVGRKLNPKGGAERWKNHRKLVKAARKEKRHRKALLKSVDALTRQMTDTELERKVEMGRVRAAKKGTKA